MKWLRKKFVIVLGAVVLAIFVGLLIRLILPIGGVIYYGDRQMAAGKKYMDSLSEKDFQVWSERTAKILSDWALNPEPHEIPVPPELKQLKILRIDVVGNDQVWYSWVGGFDHTHLEVDRLENGSFKFVARYADGKEEKVLWPKDQTSGTK